MSLLYKTLQMSTPSDGSQISNLDDLPAATAPTDYTCIRNLQQWHASETEPAMHTNMMTSESGPQTRYRKTL
jgi:hypothetical protein